MDWLRLAKASRLRGDDTAFTRMTEYMIIGIGTDIVEIARIESMLARRGAAFLEKVFTPAEIDYAQSRTDMAASFAKRWAGKEAVVKALGRGFGAGLYWRDVEISGGGQPGVTIHRPDAIDGLDQITMHLSLSDDAGLALAFAIIEKSE